MGGTLTWKGVRGDPDSTSVFGLEFVRGEPTAVPADVFEKLKGNPCFEVVGGAPVQEPEQDDKVALQAELESWGVKVDKRWAVERLQEELAKVQGEEQG